MNVIVFGGAGFLGSWIVKKLIESDYNVTVFDLKIDNYLLKKLIGDKFSQVKFITGDIFICNITKSVVIEVEIIIFTQLAPRLGCVA